jgi:flagellar hook protein FlgE
MISNNISSIQAHQSWMNSNSNNVANVNTERYVPTETTLNENGQNSVRADNVAASDTGATQSQTDLATELTDQITIEKGVGVNVAAIKTEDQILGTLLDMKA